MRPIFGREPSLWLTSIGALLSLIAGFGLDWLTPAQAIVVVVVLNAVVGAVNAALVRPVAPAAFTYLVSSAFSLVAAYGVHVPQATIAQVNAAVLAVLALVLRGSVTPVPAGAPPQT